MLLGDGLVQRVKVFEDGDWDWADLGRKRVLLCVCCKLLYQAKVKFAHRVV